MSTMVRQEDKSKSFVSNNYLPVLEEVLVGQNRTISWGKKSNTQWPVLGEILRKIKPENGLTKGHLIMSRISAMILKAHFMLESPGKF